MRGMNTARRSIVFVEKKRRAKLALARVRSTVAGGRRVRSMGQASELDGCVVRIEAEDYPPW